MIPQKLEIKNFLSYGDQIQTIDFSGHEMICLSGKNGNGKSALLDAITWAVWGQARKTSGTSKADEGLLHLGSTRMMVSFQFQAGGQTYRIQREFSKTYGKSIAALDVTVLNPATNSFISLTDKTIKATQEKLEQLIGIDYDTFVNSSFLRQGQSNEFSKRTPKERKQILATILGLSQYDTLQQKALDKARGLEEKKRLLAHSQESMLKELEAKTSLEEQHAALTQELADCAQRATEHEKLYQELQKQLAAYATTRQKRDACVEQRTALDVDIHEKRTQHATLAHTWRTTHASLLALTDEQTLTNMREELSRKEQAMLEERQRHLELQESLLRITSAQTALLHALNQKHAEALHTQQLELQKITLQAGHLAATLQTTQMQIATTDKQLTALTQQQTEEEKKIHHAISKLEQGSKHKHHFEKRKLLYQKLVTLGNQAKANLAELDTKKHALHDPANPSCPLCEQMVTLKRKQFLINQFSHQEKQLVHRIGKIKILLARLKELLTADHQTVLAHEADEKALTLLQAACQERATKITFLTTQHEQLTAQLATLTKQHQEALQAQQAGEKAIALDQSEHKTVQSKHPELISLNTQQQELQIAIDAIAYSPEQFQALQQQRAYLRTLEEKRAQASTLRTQQAVTKNSVHQLGKALKTLATSRTILEKNIATLEKNLAQEPDVISRMTRLLEEKKSLHAKREAAVSAQARIMHELERLKNLTTRLADIKQQIKALDEELSDFHLLATAFGKNGIQALLIQEAIPEIEQEANALLSRLTNNQAQIFIESLRDLKSGGVRETLDIQITDTAGARPYEMYSGGEAFRIDFALRIAISKLLARRAGTALQTLIIDEGFGSQDEDGLARIMEALYAIRQDFAKIIVVSHLGEFKENFPVHFVVSKGPTGSQVMVQERG